MIICTSFFIPPIRNVRLSELIARRHTTNTLLYSTSIDRNNEYIKTPKEDEEFQYPAKIPYPKSLSPSSALEFKKCPQSYLFQYLYEIKQPTNIALAKGSLCHSALEKLYDLKQQDRTFDNLGDIFRKQWCIDKKTKYKDLFMLNDVWDVNAEKEFGEQSLSLLKNYYDMEDPTKVNRPNPVHRERWVRADLSIDPSLGVTCQTKPQETTNNETFLVRGIIDRVDLTRDPLDGSIVLKIVDYKTSSPPIFKYSPSTNARILQEQFWQLKVYALLLREQYAHVEGYSVPFRSLRLMFLGGDDPRYLDFDLGSTQEERDLVLHDIHVELAGVWKDIVELVEKQDPKAFKHCDRSFCWCHQVRPRFAPGTLWDHNGMH